VQTLVLTDIATGWTECVPVVVRSGELVIEALMTAMTLFPFPLRGVDFDNDGAFMNDPVVDWCRAQGLEVTRARAYHKNDQAWVEQKNGAIVRRLIGYGRLEGFAAARSLARVYAAARLHGNLFQPSFKLKEKKRIGARVIKRYHAPQPPIARVLAHAAASEDSKARLRGLYAQADPVLLLAEIRAAQAELGERVDRRERDRRASSRLPSISIASRPASARRGGKASDGRRTGVPTAGASRYPSGRRCSMRCETRSRRGSIASRRSRRWGSSGGSRRLTRQGSPTSICAPCSEQSKCGAGSRRAGFSQRAPP
jgi:hypothetical protein